MPMDLAGPAAPPRRRRRVPRGWIPDQHGAWAMLAVPLLVGVVASGGAWAQVPLALLWFCGYLAFYAVGQWLRSRRKARYLPPVRAYALACVPLGLLVVALSPGLLRWVPVFVPLLVVSLWCSHRRADRSLLNDAVTVLAACLMLPVAFDAAAPAGAGGWPRVWYATILVLAYFLGTVLYVKTVIRERGSRRYLVGSIAYHAALVALPWAAWWVVDAVAPRPGPGPLDRLGLGWTLAFFVLAALRATLVPRTSATPKRVGTGEIGFSAALTVILLLKVV